MGEIVPMKEQQIQTRLDVEIQKQLKRFRLDVKLQADGGCLGILGPSGCGKSMTLKSIAGKEPHRNVKLFWAILLMLRSSLQN